MIVELGKETQVNHLMSNQIVGSIPDKGLTIDFKGKGNILCVEDGIRFQNSRLTFSGDESLIYLSQNKKHVYNLNLSVWKHCGIFIGKDNYFNGVFTAIASEHKNIIIGNDGVFSFGIWIRTSDPHLVYSIKDHKRMNLSKSVVVGDHVWIGQNALILKGSRIGSGSVLAGGSVLTGKTVFANSIWGGNPAKELRTDVFFSSKSVNNYDETQTEASLKDESKEAVYLTSSTNTCLKEDWIKRLDDLYRPEEKLKFLERTLIYQNNKYRFAYMK